jgi:DNA-binding MarR family transcriptional regulator
MTRQATYDELFRSLFDVVSFFLHPRQDRLLMETAGVSLDTALFSLLIRVGYHGPLGIVELATQVDRDHSTVSRQVDKLVSGGLVVPIDQDIDRRVRRVGLTEAGRVFVEKIATARRAMMREALQDWDKEQLMELQDNLGHLAETLRTYARAQGA